MRLQYFVFCLNGINRLNRIINQDAFFWQRSCDSLGAPSAIWSELQAEKDCTNEEKTPAEADGVHKEALCQEYQSFIWHYKTARNWLKPSFRFYKVPQLSADEYMNDTGFTNDAQLWGFSDAGNLYRWNFATREADE